ncbi:hypothetical protein PV327_010024 [Microctonus hyperodae]|uniref:C2H2-type domain-containing protein n=1 Tax=Microctonus hyperodae TaxID=165561 RepID=A0AA39F272_MICHY|nr:hypothetical protein PV327_010024 [Microctonus hyperodae]
MGETSGYEIMAESNVTDKSDTDINEFIVLTKVDADSGEAAEVETVEALINSNIEHNEQTNVGMDIKESDVYLEENLISSEKIIDNHNECHTPVLDNKNIQQEEWSNEYPVSQGEEDRIEDEHDEKTFSDFDDYEEDSDEETIATFITSAGQQLALYAVEDSDEVFAVAVYSESGEPPTNFQFLMKADVERLIGEGAVRTVKKPQQMKKQTYQGELISPHDKEIYRKSFKNSPNLSETDENSKHEILQYDDTSSEKFTRDEEVLMNNDRVQKVDVATDDEEETGINDDLTYQDILNSSYFLLEQEALKRANSKSTNNDKNEIRKQIIQENDDEITEHSTVQYILNDEDQSDSELTFDEIMKSLQHFDQNKKSKLLVKKPSEVKLKSPEKVISNGTISPQSNEEVIKSPETPVKIIPEKPVRHSLHSSPVKQKHAPNALLGRKSSNLEIKQTVFIQGSTALICCPISDIEKSIEKSCKESPDCSFKIKRPRKQQLTIVDRADSEIIIQPASMVSDEEEEAVPKKRGRQKKRHQKTLKSTMKSKRKFSKRLSSNEQRSRIEIIEIDIENDVENVEDEDSEQHHRRRDNIKEVITIEDGKEKESSDKENEIIMVGDSDDDEDDTKKGKEEKIRINSQKNVNATILKCNHCNRTFRQKRALETHSRICPKSPNTRRRLTTNRPNSRRTNEPISALKKQYVCKICQEKFDVVVALARHVRSHYKKKETIASVSVEVQMKNKQELANTNTSPVSTTVIPQKIDSKKQIIIEQKGKERLNIHRGWNSKKTSCIDCGRWFASVALLSAHCLQHATKKSEKSLKRCQICKKRFRSRLIYIRHMRMHNNAKQLQKRIKRTRQSMNTITTLRKRGRPRKL